MITDEQVMAAIAEFYKSGTGNGGMRKALEAYEQSKPKPEPVAWVDMSLYPPIRFKEGSIRLDLKPFDGLALYTTPPTREPLSDDAVLNLMFKGCYQSIQFVDGSYGIALDKTTAVDFARDIEHAHGIGAKKQ